MAYFKTYINFEGQQNMKILILFTTLNSADSGKKQNYCLICVHLGNLYLQDLP